MEEEQNITTQEIEARIKQLEINNEELIIEKEIILAGAKSGIMPSAIQDLINRGKKEFHVDQDGKIIALTGQKVEDWVSITRDIAPHLWPQGNRGAGAMGGAIAADNAVVLSKKDASDHQSYLRAKALAEKRGVRLVIR